MTTKLYAFECGRLTMPSGIFLADTEGMMTVPVPAFLIDHPKGKVLFDSGLNQALHDHQDTYFEPLGDLRDSVIVDFTPGQEIDRVLERLDIDAGDITHLVNSHLHFDHAGGNEKIPNAPVVVQRREWIGRCGRTRSGVLQTGLHDRPGHHLGRRRSGPLR